MSHSGGDKRTPLKLLLVEDSASDAELILDALVEAGFSVQITRVEDEPSYRSALIGRVPDAILSDWTLPRFSGEIAFDFAREVCPEVPFIFVSGTISETSAIHVMRRGAVDFIFKHQLQLLGLALDRALQEVKSRRSVREHAILNATILDSVTSEIAVLDGEGVIIAVNKSWRTFSQLNCSTSDLAPASMDVGANYLTVCGRSSSSIEDGSEALSARDGISGVLSGTSALFRMEYACHSPQERRWFSLSVTPLGQFPERGAVVVHTNITERKEREFLLQESHALRHRHAIRVEALLSLATVSEGTSEAEFLQHGQLLAMELTSSQLAFIHFGSKDQLEKARITWSQGTQSCKYHATVDRQFLMSHIGIWPDDLRVKCHLEVGGDAQNDATNDCKNIEQLLSIPVMQGGVEGMVMGVANGATGYSNWDVESIRLLAEGIWNIVRQRRSDRALRVSEQRHRLLADNAVDVIWTMNLEGQFTYVSPSVEKLRGFTSAEVLEQSMDQALCPESAAIAREGLWKAISAIKAGLPFVGFHGELEQPCKDGTSVWTEVNTSALKDDTGEYVGVVGVTRDITERRAQQKQLKLAAQVFAQGREGITVTDAQGNILLANRAFTEITGYCEDEVLGKNPRLLQSGRQTPEFYRAMWDAITARGQWSGEIWNRQKNGTLYPEWLTISAICDEHGAVTNYIGSFSDLSTTKAAENQILWLSHFDLLTGLPNRTLLQDRADQALSMVRRSNDPLTLMLVSIDHFTSITDVLGYQRGDDLLKEMSKRLVAAVRAQDTVARLTGKEFVLLLPGTSASGAAHLAGELLSDLSNPYFQSEGELSLTCSLGIASFPDNATTFNELITAAQVAMHRAQTNSRGTFQFYSPAMHQSVVEQEFLVKALRRAPLLDQLNLVYQPQVDLSTGRICGLEALIRWTHPTLGQVPPSTFIPIAEGSGLIVEIGEWVMNRACADLRDWLDKGLDVPHVSINVSPLQFRDNDLIGQMRSVLAKWQVDPALIYVELTEGALMIDARRSEGLLNELKAFSLRLSLDDFGTGYSSLSYLKRFPFDEVKIDQSFVRDLATDANDAMLVKVIVSMAHGFGMKVIAEGVETEAQLEILRTSVCDEIQGYFFSKPVSKDSIEEILVQGKKLPSHLLRSEGPQRTILLVDDEPNIVSSLKRLLRRDGHNILTANSGHEGLEVLSKHKVDLIVSDQRMAGMTGVEFLRKAKVNFPDTVRIVLSGYTELASVTDAINEGAVYRFLTKPWEDEPLREEIRNALEYRDLIEQTRQVDIKVQSANRELVAANRELSALINQKRNHVEDIDSLLTHTREAVSHIPTPVIGVTDQGMVLFSNAAAQVALASDSVMVGTKLSESMPSIHAAIAEKMDGGSCLMNFNNTNFLVVWRSLTTSSISREGAILLVTLERKPETGEY